MRKTLLLVSVIFGMFIALSVSVRVVFFFFFFHQGSEVLMCNWDDGRQSRFVP